jgi:hypothetical protein
LRPSFLHKFEKRGVTLPNELFVKPQAKMDSDQLPAALAR